MLLMTIVRKSFESCNSKKKNPNILKCSRVRFHQALSPSKITTAPNRTQAQSSSHSTFHPGATSGGSHISAFHDFEINCEAMAFPGTVEPNHTDTTNKTKPSRIPSAPPLRSAGCAQSFSRKSCSADHSSSNMHTHTRTWRKLQRNWRNTQAERVVLPDVCSIPCKKKKTDRIS